MTFPSTADLHSSQTARTVTQLSASEQVWSSPLQSVDEHVATGHWNDWTKTMNNRND